MTTLRSGTWSARVKRDDPFFSTFFSSHSDTIPSELRFDDWDWLPKQWKSWIVLRGLLAEGDKWRWSSSLLSLRFGIIHYSDVAFLAGAMLDLPKGWEICTIIDDRASMEDRVRLFKQNGEIIRKDLESRNAEPHDKWYNDLIHDRPYVSCEGLSSLFYAQCSKVCEGDQLDILIGAEWNARLASSNDELTWTNVDWKLLWKHYGPVLSTSQSARSRGKAYYTIVNTVEYLANPSTIIHNGAPLLRTCDVFPPLERIRREQVDAQSIQNLRQSQQVLRRLIDAVDVGIIPMDYRSLGPQLKTLIQPQVNQVPTLTFTNLRPYAYDVSLEGINNGGPFWLLGFCNAVKDVNMNDSILLETYVTQVNAHLMYIARSRLASIHGDQSLATAISIPTKYSLAVALFFLAIIGRKNVSIMVGIYDRDTVVKTRFEKHLIRYWRVYQYDKTFPMYMVNSFDHVSCDGLLQTETVEVDSLPNGAATLHLAQDTGKWVAYIPK